MNPDPEFEPILKKWVSEKAVYRFLRTEFDQINRAAFGECLTVPTLQVKPGERNSSGDYELAERHRPAVIGIFTHGLLDEDKARRVLAHYMVDHWDNTVATDKDSEDYPAAVDDQISKSFPTGYRERAWRSFHSKQFISKACNVAKSLLIHPRSAFGLGFIKP